MRVVVPSLVAGLMFVAGAFLVYAVTAHSLADRVASPAEQVVAWGMSAGVIAAALGVAYFASERRWIAALTLGLIAAGVDGFLTHATVVKTADALAARSSVTSEATRIRDAARVRVRDAEAALERALDKQSETADCDKACKKIRVDQVTAARAERDKVRSAFDALPPVALQTAAASMTGLTDAQLGMIGVALKAVGANLLPAVLVGFATHIALGLALGAHGPATSQASAPLYPRVAEPVELVAVNQPPSRSLPRPVATQAEARALVAAFAAQRLVTGSRKRLSAEALWTEFWVWQSGQDQPLVPIEMFGAPIADFCESHGCTAESGIITGIGLRRAISAA